MERITITEDPKQKGIDLYYKLHKCLKRSLSGKAPNGDELSCHTNSIIRHLAKSIESGEEWYDESVDIWCDYFLSKGANNFEKITVSAGALSDFLRTLPVIDGPWDKEFQNRFCRNCKESGLESCEDGCPNAKKRNNPEWWLSLDAKSSGNF